MKTLIKLVVLIIVAIVVLFAQPNETGLYILLGILLLCLIILIRHESQDSLLLTRP